MRVDSCKIWSQVKECGKVGIGLVVEQDTVREAQRLELYLRRCWRNEALSKQDCAVSRNGIQCDVGEQNRKQYDVWYLYDRHHLLRRLLPTPPLLLHLHYHLPRRLRHRLLQHYLLAADSVLQLCHHLSCFHSCPDLHGVANHRANRTRRTDLQYNVVRCMRGDRNTPYGTSSTVDGNISWGAECIGSPGYRPLVMTRGYR